MSNLTPEEWLALDTRRSYGVDAAAEARRNATYGHLETWLAVAHILDAWDATEAAWQARATP